MANRGVDNTVRHIRRVVLQGGAGLTDGQLLGCFLASRDEAAFEAIVRRHGPLVFGVCRRVLRHTQDAEDAFQATFLILVRKAADIGRRELLANWLYGVAVRVSAPARLLLGKRRTREAGDLERIAGARRVPGPPLAGQASYARGGEHGANRRGDTRAYLVAEPVGGSRRGGAATAGEVSRAGCVLLSGRPHQ